MLPPKRTSARTFAIELHHVHICSESASVGYRHEAGVGRCPLHVRAAWAGAVAHPTSRARRLADRLGM